MGNHGKPGSTLTPLKKETSQTDTIPKMSSINCCSSGGIYRKYIRFPTMQVYHTYRFFVSSSFERSWCPDRTLAQARKYVRKAMGTRFAEPVILNLHATWEESDTRTPLICFLSMGSDPTDQIEALAKNLELGKTECFRFLFHTWSKRQKLTPIVPIIHRLQSNINGTRTRGACEETYPHIDDAGERHSFFLKEDILLWCHVADGLWLQGGWVLLQNCHLGLEFMDELLDTVSTAESPHDTFRVWITTEPHNLFSITLLQVTLYLRNKVFQLAISLTNLKIHL